MYAAAPGLPIVIVVHRGGEVVIMPKIDIAGVPERRGVGYPAPFDAPCTERIRQRLGNAGGIGDFGINLMRLPPGNWSSQRHWYSHEDEFVYVLAGELVLIEHQRRRPLRAQGRPAISRAVVSLLVSAIASRTRAG
jgi:hypothetical protein